MTGGKATTFHSGASDVSGLIALIQVNADDPEMALYRQAFGNESAPVNVTSFYYRGGRTAKKGDLIKPAGYLFGRVETGDNADITIIWAEKPPAP